MKKNYVLAHLGQIVRKKKTSTSEEQRAKAGYHAHPLHAPPLKGWENHLSHPPWPNPWTCPYAHPIEGTSSPLLSEQVNKGSW